METVPPNATDWIIAVVSSLTLIAAGVAGYYAKQAARWTRAQAESAEAQVDVATQSLEEAQSQTADARAMAEHQRQESARAHRRLLEARYDQSMPTVLVSASPGIADLGNERGLLEINQPTSNQDWSVVAEPFEIAKGEGEGLALRINLTIHLENLSSQIAQVAVVSQGTGEVSVKSGQAVLVRPGQKEHFTWTKFVSVPMLQSDGFIENEQHSILRMHLWVRDLSMSTYDIVEVLADLRFFERDGSRLVVRAGPAFPFVESVGLPLPGRVYDRLDFDERESALSDPTEVVP